MTAAPSSLGLLSGYKSSSSEEEEDEAAAGATYCLISSKSDGSSEEETDNYKKTKTSEASPLPSARLPAPCLGVQGALTSSSVFSNPFQDEKQAQLSILERHVKLSDGNWAKGGKGVCLAYQRDGRCRYGTKCKYSHASDLPQGSAAAAQRELIGSDSSNTSGEIQSSGTGEGQDEGPPHDKGKRKKPGLSDTLVPPKRSLKSFQKQMTAERPWALG